MIVVGAFSNSTKKARNSSELRAYFFAKKKPEYAEVFDIFWQW